MDCNWSKNWKSKFPEIQIILVTGNGSIENAAEAIKNGAFTYVQKPVNTEELLINLSKIERAYGYKTRKWIFKIRTGNMQETILSENLRKQLS